MPYRTKPCTHPKWVYNEAGISRCVNCGSIHYDASNHVKDLRGAVALLEAQRKEAQARIAELEKKVARLKGELDVMSPAAGLGRWEEQP